MLKSPRFISGYVVHRPVQIQSMPTYLKAPKIAVIDFDLTKTREEDGC